MHNFAHSIARSLYNVVFVVVMWVFTCLFVQNYEFTFQVTSALYYDLRFQTSLWLYNIFVLLL